MYFASLVSARILGPDAFGQLSFAMVLAQLLSILTVRGFDFSAGRAAVLARGPREVRDVAGTAYATVAVATLLTGVLLIAASGVLARVLDWPRLSVVGAGLLLLPFGIRALNERLLPALGMTGTLAAIRPVEGVLLLITLGAITIGDRVGPWAVLGAMASAGWLIVLVLFASVARNGMVGKFDPAAYRRMTPYANVVLAMTLVPLPLLFGDRLTIQAELTEADLGLYVACATATQLLAAQLVALLSGVLLPNVLREGANAVARLRRVGRAILLPSAGAFACALIVSLAVLGSSYRPHAGLVVTFSLLAAVQLTNGLLHVGVLADPNVLLLDVRLTAIRAGLFVAALVALSAVDRVSLMGVAGTLLVSESIQTAILWRLSDRVQTSWSAGGPSAAD